MKPIQSVDDYLAHVPQEAREKLLPLDLIKKLVEARVKKNDEAEKKK